MEFFTPKTIETDTVFPLWQEAFGDREDAVRRILRAMAPHSRLFLAMDGNVPVSMLFAVEQQVSGAKISYIYAVATKKSHRGQGLAARLLSFAEEALQGEGVSACLLSPAEESLCAYYARLGYAPWGQGAKPAANFSGTPVSPGEYLALREEALRDIPHNIPPESILSLYTLTDRGAWENTRCVESLLAPCSAPVMVKRFSPNFPSSGYFSFLMD